MVIDIDHHRYLTGDVSGLADAIQIAAIQYDRRVEFFCIWGFCCDAVG